MSYASFLVFFKMFHDLNLLILSEKLWGWFSIRHVFEEYNFSAGKIFIINNDFRTLIKNIVLLARNLIFLAQAFSPSEFILINIILMCLILFCNSQLTRNYIRFFVFGCYIYVLYCFLVIDMYFILLFIKYLSIVTIVIFSIYFYLYLISFYFLHKFINRISIKYLSIFVLKLIFIIIFSLLVFNCLLSDLNFLFYSSENFAQEIAIKFLIIYSYFYYF